MSLRESLTALGRSAGTGVLATLMAGGFAHAQDRYVNAQCGSNFNDGLTPATAWRNVDFALNGPHAPLALDTTIHLLATDVSVSYSAANGESFPWVLYNNVSLVGAPGLAGCGSGPVAPVVDGAGAPLLISLAPDEDFAGNFVRGLTLRSAQAGIGFEPAGATHITTVEHCTFAQCGFENAVRFHQPSTGRVNAIVRSNSFTDAGVLLSGFQADSNVAVESNNFAGFSRMSTQSYGGAVQCRANSMNVSGVAMMLVGFSTWHVNSSIEHNTISGPQAGIFVQNSHGITVRANTITQCAYGVHAWSGSSSLALIANDLSSNSIGVVIENNAQGIVLIENTIAHNTGVGIRDLSCRGTVLSRNLIHHNQSHGVQLMATTTVLAPSIDHNTIVDNGGAGLMTALASNTPTYVSNCVIWGNNGSGCDIAGLSIGQYRYCAIGDCASPGFGNLSSNPLFANSLNSDYRLLAGSPCIDTADPSATLDCDGSRSDIGALPYAECVVTFCTAGTSANGCAASISASAQPSVSFANACTLSVANVEGAKSGLLFYGVDNSGFSAVPWGSGSSYLCVKSPTQRTDIQSTGGSANACDGALSLDWNAYQLATPLALGNPWLVGAKVYVQGWYRDPPASKSTSLSDALELTYAP